MRDEEKFALANYRIEKEDVGEQIKDASDFIDEIETYINSQKQN